MDQSGQVAVAELHRRQIDRDLQRLGPGCRLAARLAHDPLAHRDDQPALLGERDEGAGRDHAALRMLPSNQRLEPDDLAGDARLRLVVHRQLAAFDRGAKLLLQDAAVAQPPVHVGLEEAECAASFRFGAIERRVGIGDQRCGIGAVDREYRNADADADAHRLAVDDDVLVDRREQPIRQVLGRGWLISIGGDHHEFIAAKPSQEGTASGRLQAL